MNILIFIIDQYFQYLILLILFLYLVLILSFFFKIALQVISEFLLSNCQKCKHVFLFYWLIIRIMLRLMKLLYWICFRNGVTKIRNGATLWKQFLNNILFKMYYFKFINIASSVGINKKSVVYMIFYITCEGDYLPYECFVLLFLLLVFVDLGSLQHLRWTSLWQKSKAGSNYYCHK